MSETNEFGETGWLQCSNCATKFTVQYVYPDIDVEYCPHCGNEL